VERIASIFRLTSIGELGTALAVTSNGSTLRKNTTKFHLHTKVTLATFIAFGFLLGSFIDIEDGGDIFLRNLY
jgi:hypothetical protein